MTTIDWLKEPKLYSRAEIVSSDCPLPNEFGIYAWFFKEVPPGVPVEGCLTVNGLTLLYIGLSPMKPSDTNSAKSNLRKRVRTHMMNDAEGSTLRKSLGVLLTKQTGFSLRRIHPEKKVDKSKIGKHKRMTFTNAGEQALDRWLDENAFVAVLVEKEPWTLMPEIFSQLVLPLNLDSPKKIPFHKHLSKWRNQAKKKAREKEEVEEKASQR